MIERNKYLIKETNFHEKKFELGENFSNQYRNHLWRKHWERKFEKIYIYLQDLKQDAYILNVGAGTGPVEYFLTKENKKFHNFISTDISRNGILNIKYLDLNDNLLICNATALPLRNNTFDIILFIGVLHHIPEEKFYELFLEVQRVIKPNGIVIASEPLPNISRKIIKNLFYTTWKNIHSEDEREVEWKEIESLKNNLQINEIIIKPVGFFIDLLINIKILNPFIKLLSYAYIFDIILEKLHIGWSYFIYIKFKKHRILKKI